MSVGVGFAYIQGADLPDLTIEWRDRNNALVLFSSVAHTFVLTVGTPGQPSLLTKSSGFTAADTNPNLTVAWSTSGELNTLPPGNHTCQIVATRTSDSKQRIMQFTLPVRPANG